MGVRWPRQNPESQICHPGEPQCPPLCNGNKTALTLLLTSVNGHACDGLTRTWCRALVSTTHGLLPGRGKRRKARLGLGCDLKGGAGGKLLPPSLAPPGLSQSLWSWGSARGTRMCRGKSKEAGLRVTCHFSPGATEGGTGGPSPGFRFKQHAGVGQAG